MNKQAPRSPQSSSRPGTAHLGLVAAFALTLYSYPRQARAQPVDPAAESSRLFYEGSALLREGKTAEACEKLELSVALQRRGGALYNLAVCREELGQLLVALELFGESVEDAIRHDRRERADSARQNIASLQEKLAWITLAFAGGEIAQAAALEIRINGAVVPPEDWSTPVPAMPGAYVVSASAPGKQRFEVRVTGAKAGETHQVEIPILQGSAPAPVTTPEPRPRSPEIPRAPGRADSLSHAWQIGALARVDVEPLLANPGARAVLGLTFGLGDHFELGASALVGPIFGVEPQLTFYFLGRSAFKPLLNAGAPLFFADGLRAGIRGSAGLAWDPLRHLGFFATVGAAHFPEVPEDYAHTVFLPAAGVQGRL